MNLVNKDKIILGLQGGLLFLNIVAVLLLSGFVNYTTTLIISHYDARNFLNQVETIPHSTTNMFWVCVICMVSMIATFILRNVNDKSSSIIVGTLIIDVFITLIVILKLDCNYNGLIFLVFANVLYYANDRKLRIGLVALAVSGYLVANYDFLSLKIKLFDVKDYIGYYSGTQQQYFMSIYNVIISLNIILFIVYCIYVINSQSNTIEEVNQLYHELQSANEQLQEYASMSEEMAKTQERNRLAREIHDTLGHALTGIAVGIDACITTIDTAPEATKKQLELLSQVSRDGIKDIRRSVSELKPDSADRLPLEVAIRKMITDMSQVSGAKILFETNEKHMHFDEDEENAIYRVIQESITNALRHGKATKIKIDMNHEGGEMKLVIKDNGIGCEKIKSGFGTKHIQERIEMLHGTVLFDGSNGFTVAATIPIRWGENHD